VPSRAYGQYCGLARAVEILGERWGLLIVRDLLVSAKRFTDLQRGLPGIPSNVLAARLKELEAAGVVQRRVLPRPSGSIVYELTPYGEELEEVLIGIGRWGAKSLGDPAPDEIVTPDALVMAMRTTFRPESAGKLRASYELHVGPAIVHARIENGTIHAKPGPIGNPDLVIEAGPGIRLLMANEITAEEALKKGIVHISGKRELLDRFADIFRIDPKPAVSSRR
jgi:DNA-binding HxlR family transcriptional regulator